MRIRAISTDITACHWYRISEPLRALNEMGHRGTWGTTLTRDDLIDNDVIIAQYLHNPTSLTNWVHLCEAQRNLCVWEIDDDIHDITPDARPNPIFHDRDHLTATYRAIAASHLVTVPTERLADVYSRYNPNIAVIPNYLPRRTMTGRSDYLQHPSKFTVGYTGSIGHLTDMRRWVKLCEPWLSRRRKDVELHIMGIPRNAIEPHLPPWLTVRYTPHTTDMDTYQKALVGSMTVGIAPLNDTTLNRGRADSKLVEYLSAGILPIATPGVANAYDTTAANKCVWYAETGGQWRCNLETLFRTPRSTLLRLGRKGYRHVLHHHILEDHIGKRVGIYHEHLGLLRP